LSFGAVHVRGIFGRGLRLELVLGLGVAVAMPALALAAEDTQSQATQTSLSAETRDSGGQTQATVTLSVLGADGLPATGAVLIRDHGKEVAGVALSDQGTAKTVLSLPAGNHALSAAYVGNSSHQASTSLSTSVTAQATATPSYTVSASPATLSLTAGDTGTVAVSVTPSNASSLTAPIFVTLSCSGLPDESSCTFTPASVEILSTSTTALTSSMAISTVKATTTSSSIKPVNSPIALALLIPGALGLLGLAVGGRRRRWLVRTSLVALVGLVAMLGTTACNPRYNYLNHGPTTSIPTPSGTYTVTIAAQSSDGVTATNKTTTIALTVK
jgi:hypothetical protein